MMLNPDYLDASFAIPVFIILCTIWAVLKVRDYRRSR